MESSHETKMEGGALQARVHPVPSDACTSNLRLEPEPSLVQVGVMPSAALLPATHRKTRTVGGSRHVHIGHTGAVVHLGCFHLSSTELAAAAKEAKWSPDACAKHCGVKGFLYAVLRTPKQCSCGDDFGSAGAAVHGQCDHFCSDSADFCGAASIEVWRALRVYRLMLITRQAGVGSVFESTLKQTSNLQANVGCFAMGTNSAFTKVCCVHLS